MNEIVNTIEAFERRCGLKICFHDYTGQIRKYIQYEKVNNHDNAYCQYVRRKNEKTLKCQTFDMRKIQIYLSRHPDGFFKMCHGGVIEYTAPVFYGANIAGTVFIGIFRLRNLSSTPEPIICFCERKDLHPEINCHYYDKIPYLSEHDFQDIGEIAKSIKIRLETLLDKEEVVFASHEDKIRWEIGRYVRANSQKNITIQDMAKHLCLSISRTGHLIRDLFGMTYPELLTNNRITSAKLLLSSTFLSVSEIACRCGFSDPAYFHRIFKKMEKLTPGEYRSKNKIKGLNP